MKFSELWLREWVNVKLDIEAISNQITMAGLEVDNIKSVTGLFNGVVIGKIIECKQHPKDNKLNISKVDIGFNHPLNIVCCASNCRKGIKVAVATVGAILPGNLEIKVINIHDELSEGMLCSFSELGIYKNNNINIIEFPANARIGTDIRKYLKLDDSIIEVNITPNRADCLCIMGIARDLAALNKTKLNKLKIKPAEINTSDKILIKVDVPEFCPRYLGRVINNININATTPIWMKEKLRRCGIDSVNPVFDTINYVLIELGQPIYVFDKDRIEGGIIVRMAKKIETMILLSGKKVKLSDDTIVIADYNKILAIGGIFVSEDSSINKQTKNIFLECAFFSPIAIVGRAHYYNLHNNASNCYERGVDPKLQYKAMERVTTLLIGIVGGKVGPIVDITSKDNLPKQTTIMLHRKKLDRMIGYHINDKYIKDILIRLGFKITESKDNWLVIAPSWRFDIKIEEDLVEEIARIYGYNNIPDKPVKAYLNIREHCSESTLSLSRVKTMLNDKGYQEVITYSFVNPRLQQLVHPIEEALSLLNPFSKEKSVMRLSLWTGLLETIIYNQKRQQKYMRIFEVGLRFIPDKLANLGIRQDLMLAGATSGNGYEERWNSLKNKVNFYDVKGDLESILDLTGKLSKIEFRAEKNSALHPGQSAAIYLCNKIIGFIGVLNPKLEREFGLSDQTIIFELEWSKIASCIIPKAKTISRFPANRRDIAIIVAKRVPVADILAECRKIDVNKITSVELFDVYCGKNIASDHKSITISLTLQDNNRTLKDEEISATVAKCINVLIEKFQASLRE